VLACGVSSYKYIYVDFYGVSLLQRTGGGYYREKYSKSARLRYFTLAPAIFKDIGKSRLVVGCELSIPLRFKLVGDDFAFSMDLNNISNNIIPKLFAEYQITFINLNAYKR
jgi:hypothetical protein